MKLTLRLESERDLTDCICFRTYWNLLKIDTLVGATSFVFYGCGVLALVSCSFFGYSAWTKFLMGDSSEPPWSSERPWICDMENAL